MGFLKWIENEGGAKGVARMINTESPTVCAWLTGIATPRASLMVKLVKLGRGAFSFEDIITETATLKAKRKRKKK